MTKQWPYFLAAFLLPVLVVFWWWGAFAAPEVKQMPRPAVHYAYLVSEGDYSKVEERQREVRDLLKRQGIAGGQALTLIEDDPRSIPGKARKARAAIMIEAGNQPAPPLLADSLPERQALVVNARGHPFFVYGKAYGALLEHLERQRMGLRLPVAETTRDNTLTIEMAIQP